ncbi:B12-binding domain-containing radical SAM protein [Ruminiclostridium cellobioparum]|uniref:B12-binding domain-containing radical SAM protein n=1 Tax=Ruminiclostridium cellobioparum TaxID=29355 RepID=UPI0028ADC9F4|nr:radical SAM protein [Ruminiclostridium cellobioparum]
MKLALISPKGVAMGTNKENQSTAEIYEDLNGIESLKELMSCANSPLLTIAAIVEDYFEEITYIDEEIESIPSEGDYDIVAMSFMTQQASRAFELAEIFKARGSYLVCGGMHPTNSPEETLQYFDTVFIGEGEITWIEFIKDYKRNNPKQIYKNTHVIDMETVPTPKFELLKMDKYRTIPIQISRGCPHNCEFCESTKVYGPKYRHKSVEKVMKEIEIVKSLKKNPHIYFTDDNMLVNRSFSLELLDAMKGGGFRWMTHTDISLADYDEVLGKLFDSGCRKLVIGFESINPDSLKNIEKWKYNRLTSYGESIQKIQSYGVGVWGTFIVGLDNDDKSVFQRVVDFTNDNNLYGAMISVPTPFPGSGFYSRLEEEKRILSKHWGSYTLWNVVIKPAQMTVEELREGFKYTLEQIYSKEAVAKRMEYFKNVYTNMRK